MNEKNQHARKEKNKTKTKSPIISSATANAVQALRAYIELG